VRVLDSPYSIGEIHGASLARTDIDAITGAGNAVIEKISDLVNMAKADALDAMGEHQAATELVERHLGV
jgi:hypothetical protein